jgi:hypothetical protein
MAEYSMTAQVGGNSRIPLATSQDATPDSSAVDNSAPTTINQDAPAAAQTHSKGRGNIRSQIFDFPSLPSEIRNMVYKEMLPSKHLSHVDDTMRKESFYHLTMVNKQLRKDCYVFLMSRTTYRLCVDVCPIWCLCKRGPESRVARLVALTEEELAPGSGASKHIPLVHAKDAMALELHPTHTSALQRFSTIEIQFTTTSFATHELQGTSQLAEALFPTWRKALITQQHEKIFLRLKLQFVPSPSLPQHNDARIERYIVSPFVQWLHMMRIKATRKNVSITRSDPKWEVVVNMVLARL